MPASKQTYPFKVGSFNCLVISDGRIPTPEGRTSEVSPLLVKTGKNVVLVDTGCGKIRNPANGNLLENLKAEGIKPSDIDTVILTHGHSDHINGNTDTSGKPVFANARYIMQRQEWQFWADIVSGKRREKSVESFMIDGARDNLEPIKDRFTLIDGEGEIVPGIKVIKAVGHTPGNLVLMVTSGKDRLLCIGDLFHNPAEFVKDDLYAMFDVVPEKALQTKNEIISTMAIPDKLLVFAYHFPFPGLGYFGKKGGVFTWQPIEHEQ